MGLVFLFIGVIIALSVVLFFAIKYDIKGNREGFPDSKGRG